MVTTDGPYAETKEALTGFYLLEAADLDEAIAIAAEIPAAWDGAVEVRPVIRRWVDRECDARTDRLAEVIRVEGARLLATLVRTLGDWSLAEEAVQEAAIAALRDWPRTGIPDASASLADRHRPAEGDRHHSPGAGPGRQGTGRERQLMELTRPDEPDDVGPRRRHAPADLHLLPSRAWRRTPGWPSPCAPSASCRWPRWPR